MFFWSSLAFSMIHWMLAIWSLLPLPFLKPGWTSGNVGYKPCEGLLYRDLVRREGGEFTQVSAGAGVLLLAPDAEWEEASGHRAAADILNWGACAVLLSAHGMCSWSAKGSIWSAETRPLHAAPCKQVRLDKSQNKRKMLDFVLLPRAYFLFPGNCSWTLPVMAWWYLHVLLLWEY